LRRLVFLSLRGGPRIVPAIALLLVFPAWAKAQLAWESTELKQTAEAGSYQTVVHFSFRNAGGYPVSVKKIKTCCGCFRAEADKKTYRPGETGVIEAVFNHVKMSGVQTRNLTVVTDDRNSTKRLSLTLTIPKE